MLLIRDIDSILTLDARRRILERHSVLIGEGRILRIGDTATLDRDHLDTVRRTGKVIEGAGCMMLPAHVNTHVHTVEHLSRGLIPDDLATFDWASLYATPFCASLTEEEAYVSARLACLEMISNGTGTFVDCNVLASLGHLDAVAQAVEESGMRAVLGRGVTDILPPAKRTMPEALQAAVCHPSTEAALAEVDALLSSGTERAQGRIRLWALEPSSMKTDTPPGSTNATSSMVRERRRRESRADLAWTRGPGGRWWKRTRGCSPGAERDDGRRGSLMASSRACRSRSACRLMGSIRTRKRREIERRPTTCRGFRAPDPARSLATANASGDRHLRLPA